MWGVRHGAAAVRCCRGSELTGGAGRKLWVRWESFAARHGGETLPAGTCSGSCREEICCRAALRCELGSGAGGQLHRYEEDRVHDQERAVQADIGMHACHAKTVMTYAPDGGAKAGRARALQPCLQLARRRRESRTPYERPYTKPLQLFSLPAGESRAAGRALPARDRRSTSAAS